MADYNLGTASGKIEIDGKAAALGFKVAQTAGDAFFGAIKAKIASVQSLGRRMAAVGAAGVTGFGLAIKTAADFEQQMSAVQAVTGSTGDEFDALKQKAMDLGAETTFSSMEAANAIEELAKAGIPVKDILNGAADATVALAAAGGVALPEAATIAANAMNQFHLSAKKVPEVADILAGVANTSAADVSSIGQSLSQAGAVANLAGLSFRDTAIALGEMADAGIQGSDAGTSVKTMLNNLIPTTDKQINKFRELHLLTFDAADAMKILTDNGIKPLGKNEMVLTGQIQKMVAQLQGVEPDSAKAAKGTRDLMMSSGALRNEFFKQNGEIKNLRGLQDTLAKGLQGMTKQQKLATLETLFGADAMRASAILSLEGAKGYDKFSKAVGETKASDVAKQRLNNLSGAIESLKGSWESAQIVIGSIFLPAITKLVQALTFLVNIFNGLPKPIQIAIGILAAIASVILLVTGLFLAALPAIIAFVAHFYMMAAINVVTGYLRTFYATMKAGQGVQAAFTLANERAATSVMTLGKRTILASRIMLGFAKVVRVVGLAMKAAFLNPYVLALLALVVVAVILYKKWKPFHDLVDKIAALIKGKLVAAWHAIQPVIGTVLAALQKFWAFVKSSLLPVLIEVGKMLLGKALEGWKEIQKSIQDQLMPAVNELVDAFNNDVKPALASFARFMAPIISAVLTVAKVIGGILIGILYTLGYVFIKFIMPILIKIVGFLLGQVIGAVVLLVKGIIQAITGIIQIFTGLFNFFDDLFHGRWSQLWGDVLTILKGFWNLIIGAIKVYFAVGILKLVGLGFKALFAIFKGSWRLILAIFKGAGKGIWNIVKGAFELLVNVIKGYINIYKTIIQSGWKFIQLAVRAAINAIKVVVRLVFRFIGAFIKRETEGWKRIIAVAWRLIKSSFKTALAFIKGLVRSILNGIGNFIKAEINGWKAIFSKVWSTIKSLTTKAWDGIHNAVSGAITKLLNLVRELPGKIKSSLGNLTGLLYNAGRDLVQGIINGIGSMGGSIVNSIRDAAGKFAKFLPGSPVKEGPLVAWNRGMAGRKLMGLLIEGMKKDQAKAERQAAEAATAVKRAFEKNLKFDKALTYAATARAGAATPMRGVGRPPAATGKAPAGQNGSLRLVAGTLRLDPSGKAFIRGVAAEAVDDNVSYLATTKRRRR